MGIKGVRSCQTPHHKRSLCLLYRPSIQPAPTQDIPDGGDPKADPESDDDFDDLEAAGIENSVGPLEDEDHQPGDEDEDREVEEFGREEEDQEGHARGFLIVGERVGNGGMVVVVLSLLTMMMLLMMMMLLFLSWRRVDKLPPSALVVNFDPNHFHTPIATFLGDASTLLLVLLLVSLPTLPPLALYLSHGSRLRLRGP